MQQARRVTGAAKQRDAARCAIERVRQANADGRQCEELAFVAEGQVRRAADGHARHGDAATELSPEIASRMDSLPL